jgi:hypothetical protein
MDIYVGLERYLQNKQISNTVKTLNDSAYPKPAIADWSIPAYCPSASPQLKYLSKTELKYT